MLTQFFCKLIKLLGWAQRSRLPFQAMQFTASLGQFARQPGIVFVAADEFLLLGIQRVLGGAQFPLQELDLLLELPLVLFSLLPRRRAEMLQGFPRVLVLFLQRHSMGFFPRQLSFHVLDALDQLGSGSPRFQCNK